MLLSVLPIARINRKKEKQLFISESLINLDKTALLFITEESKVQNDTHRVSVNRKTVPDCKESIERTGSRNLKTARLI